MSDPVSPSRLPGNLSPVTPVLGRRNQFMPEVGKPINLMLLGEVVRAEVTEVLSHDAIVAKITGMVIDKTGHGFKRDSIVACLRSWNGLSETWEPISDRAVREREMVEAVRQQYAAPAPEPKAELAPIERAAQEPETKPHRVLGPRRNRVGSRAAPVADTSPKRSVGPRRSKVSRS